MQSVYGLAFVLCLARITPAAGGEIPARGDLLYQTNLAAATDVAEWVMEGPGRVTFRDGWMEMESPNQEFHHVFWCPQEFPDRFIAEWEAQNLDPAGGLCILFFAARGVAGEDVFDTSLPQRDGTFRWYTSDRLRSYHISYYANTPDKPDRGRANLRKNNQFRLVQEGREGIPAASIAVHRLQLIKDGPHIQLFVDDRKVIDWSDTPENDPRPPYEDGKIGFRQMRWTRFRYRNLRVWGIDSPQQQLAAMADLPVVHPQRRLWATPAMDRPAAKNPPTLLWPSSEGPGSYTVRLSRDPGFETAETIAAQNIPHAMYNPHRELGAGRWYWQVRSGQNAWSDRHQFLITEDSQRWNPPSAQTLVAAVPQSRPRVLIDAESLASFRARAGEMPEARRIISLADAACGRSPPAESQEILSIRGDDQAKTEKLQKDASERIGQAVFQAVGPLVKAYVLTGDPRYAREAVTWAMVVASWDPKGVTRINDFGDSRIMFSMALVYDTLQEFLDEDQKRILLEATAARASHFYREYVNNKECELLSNHVWQHILHYFFDTSIALLGDHPDADEWLGYLYELFLAREPVLGGEDGGWVHGLAYFRMNVETLVDIPWRIRQYTGFDFFAHTPWYGENAYYCLYGFPPGSAGTGFSDNSHDLPEPRGDYLAYADALSRIVPSAHAAWYRDRIAAATPDLTPHYQHYWREHYVLDDKAVLSLSDTTMLQWARLKYLYDLLPATPESPQALPKARAFRDVGLVTMHSQNLGEPAGHNLFLALRASPFGTFSHMLSDNNCFNLVYGGDRLFYHTGYKVAMTAPHRLQYYKHTRSHNGILVGGQGQPYSTEAYGWIENFLTGEQLSYAVGNASHAYGGSGETTDAGLKKFRRHVLMLRPDIVVIYDVLEAERSVEWSYLLHSYDTIEMAAAEQTLSTQNRAGRAVVHLLGSEDTAWSVTQEYPVPAENWRGNKDPAGNPVEYKNNARHFTATSGKTRQMRFLAFYQVRPHGEAEGFNEILPIDRNTFRIGGWKVSAALSPDLPERLQVVNTIEGVSFASAGAILEGPGESATTTPPLTARLSECTDGRTLLQESPPQIPRAAEEAIRFFRAGGATAGSTPAASPGPSVGL